MKRSLAAFLAVFYLLLSSGASVHAHYCMGKLIGATLSHAAAEEGGEHSCDRCGMAKDSNGGCCHDEEATFKVSEAQQGFAQLPNAAPDFVADLPLPLFAADFAQPVSLRPLTSVSPTNGPPPLPSDCPIYVRVCNFRI